MKAGKAPGSDHLDIEAIKTFVEEIPKIPLDNFNWLLKHQDFPLQWKKAAGSAVGGRTARLSLCIQTICLLSILGKFYKRMTQNRIEEELRRGNGLSET